MRVILDALNVEGSGGHLARFRGSKGLRADAPPERMEEDPFSPEGPFHERKKGRSIPSSTGIPVRSPPGIPHKPIHTVGRRGRSKIGRLGLAGDYAGAFSGMRKRIRRTNENAEESWDLGAFLFPTQGDNYSYYSTCASSFTTRTNLVF